jgi:hypothetical protein
MGSCMSESYQDPKINGSRPNNYNPMYMLLYKVTKFFGTTVFKN